MTHDGTRDAVDAPRPGLQPPVPALPAPHERASAAGQPLSVGVGAARPTTTAVPALAASPAGTTVADPPRPNRYRGAHRRPLFGNRK